ncbi:hypothetical protein NIES4071_101930 (plasmid) [Calothrix sp. NIES-4071]|nr:hypothetical protein NIES4071_101930 [Calothrix sp. NIES-4071]BAZ64574.1 hypothetical protein NIES4105_103070 [Calothrix sp. NIES-4105]
MVKLDNPIIIDGISYCSVENAYQAAKTLNLQKRVNMAALEPGYSKKVGRKLKLRNDWESIKLAVMYIALTQKFSQPAWNNELKAIGIEYLVEWNNWKDNIWGIPCKISPKWFAIPNKQSGNNYLGRLLMLIRNEPIDTNSYTFDDSDKLRTLNNMLLDRLAPSLPQEKILNSATHYETSLLPSQRVSVAVYGSPIGAMTPEIATRLDNLIDLGAQIYLCDNSFKALTDTIKDYLDSKCYTRVTWSNSQNLSNTQYGLLIKHDSDDSNYNYHATNKTRMVTLAA